MIHHAIKGGAIFCLLGVLLACARVREGVLESTEGVCRLPCKAPQLEKRESFGTIQAGTIQFSPPHPSVNRTVAQAAVQNSLIGSFHMVPGLIVKDYLKQRTT